MTDNIMRPKFTWIGNMCFRELNSQPQSQQYEAVSEESGKTIDNYCDEPQCSPIETIADNQQTSNDCTNDEESDDGIELIKTNGIEKYKCDLKISQMFYAIICGKQALTKRTIETDTNTEIYIPKEHDYRKIIEIKGISRSAVKSAKSKIESIVASKRQFMDFTHFVSLPLNQTQIVDSFMKFKDQLLSSEECVNSQGVDQSLFQTPNKLHLTIVPLLLCDKQERDIAANILDQCFNDYIKTLTKGPINVKLEGIDYMNDDPTQVYVLYAKVIDLSENQCLQQICDEILSRFKQSKLISGRVYDRVKLHMTVMNSSFRKASKRDNQRDSNYRNGRKERSEPFDATNIIKQFSNFSFGSATIDAIHISIRHSNSGDDVYYSHSKLVNLKVK